MRDSHSDCEVGMIPNAKIVIVSIGATRNVVFKNKIDKTKTTIPLTNGHVLVMGSGTQSKFRHKIPKVNQSGPRIGIVFRQFEE